MDILKSNGALRFLFQIGCLSQWCTVEHKKLSMIPSKRLMSLTTIVIMISLAMLGQGISVFEGFNQTKGNGIGEVVLFIQMIGTRIAHIVSLIEALFRTKEEMKFFAAVRGIDRIFELSLGLKIDNGLFQRRALQRGAFILMVYVASGTFIWTTKLTVMQIPFSYFSIFYIFPFLVCGLRYFQICNAILIIKYRFDYLTNAFSRVNSNNAPSTSYAEDTVSVHFISKELAFFGKAEPINRKNELEKPDVKLLLTIRDIYNRLWELNSILNSCFGISMLISVANDFVAITSNCYWTFISFKEYSSSLLDSMLIAASVVSSLPHLFNVIGLAIICEKAVQSTANIALGVHNIKIDLLNDYHNTLKFEYYFLNFSVKSCVFIVSMLTKLVNKVEQFSLQLLHQKLAFTAAGFFNVDCTLLYTIVGVTTTYLMILIQFHMSEQRQNSQ